LSGVCGHKIFEERPVSNNNLHRIKCNAGWQYVPRGAVGGPASADIRSATCLPTLLPRQGIQVSSRCSETSVRWRHEITARVPAQLHPRPCGAFHSPRMLPSFNRAIACSAWAPWGSVASTKAVPSPMACTHFMGGCCGNVRRRTELCSAVLGVRCYRRSRCIFFDPSVTSTGDQPLKGARASWKRGHDARYLTPTSVAGFRRVQQRLYPLRSMK
jgi:hypothetical protein